MPQLFWKLRQKALLNLEFKTSLNNLTSPSWGWGSKKCVENKIAFKLFLLWLYG